MSTGVDINLIKSMDENIIMSKRELDRYEVIRRLVEKDINGTEAAKLLSLTVRQTKRLKAKVKEHGAPGIIHGNKGKKGNKAMKPEKIMSIKSFITRDYSDFGPTFTSEKLWERHKIKTNKESVRMLMAEMGLWQPKSRKHNKEYRAWRPRKDHYGEMVQFDGSYHDWFEGRGEKTCLLAAIDDATGKITKAKSARSESVEDILLFWKKYVETHGKPLNIYLDRHSTYKQNQKSVFDNPDILTQFERVMQELGIKVIHANSPQAKGRIERLFGTLQDRLVKEMRLAGIRTAEKANKFIEEIYVPKHNNKFSVVPNKKGDLHRPLSKTEQEKLDSIFSIRRTRVVNNDFTVSYENQWLQLEEKQPTLVLRKDKVVIEEWLGGSLHLTLRGKELRYEVLPERPPKVAKLKIHALTRTKSSWRPPADHPWKRSFLYQKSKVAIINLPK